MIPDRILTRSSATALVLGVMLRGWPLPSPAPKPRCYAETKDLGRTARIRSAGSPGFHRPGPGRPRDAGETRRAPQEAAPGRRPGPQDRPIASGERGLSGAVSGTVGIPEAASRDSQRPGILLRTYRADGVLEPFAARNAGIRKRFASGGTSDSVLRYRRHLRIVTGALVWIIRTLDRTSAVASRVEGSYRSAQQAAGSLHGQRGSAGLHADAGRRGGSWNRRRCRSTPRRGPSARRSSRILWSVQVGVVLGGGRPRLLFVSNRVIEEVAPAALRVGVLALAVGAGFVVSAGASFLLSRRLGLFEPPVPPREHIAERRGNSPPTHA